MAGWCTRNARHVVIGWLIVMCSVVIAGFVVGEKNSSTFRLPGTDSQRATDLISQTFPSQRGDYEAVVVSTTAGKITSGPPRSNAEALFSRLRQIPGVMSVADPLTDPSHGVAPISLNKKTAIAVLHFRQQSVAVPQSEAKQLVAVVRSSRAAGFQVAVIGQAVENAEANPPPFAEIAGFLAATVVLLFAFGSLVAVAVALGNALISVGLSYGLLQLASHVLPVPYFAPQIALTIGLGVGIDYGLLTVARYRGARQRAAIDPGAPIAALNRAGRTVAFAGGTVILAELGLLVCPFSLVRGLTVAVAIAVIPTVLAANTLLPALLALSDGRLDSYRPPMWRGRELVERSAAWGRWAAKVQRRPWLSVSCALIVLGLLAAPILWLRLGPASGATDNPASMTNQAYTMATDAFGPGVTSPFEVVATLHDPKPKDVQELRNVLLHTTDVVYVSAAQRSADRDRVLVDVIPASGPDSIASAHLLSALRTGTRDQLNQDGISITIGGQAAVESDLAAQISHAFPLTVLAVIGSSFLLLLLQFRSVVIAAKAGVMNLLSIGAAFGVVVAIFQWGWGGHLIGSHHTGPIETFLPIVLFPAVFGLSMDYEVFLLSRITDEWTRTQDSTAAVIDGLATTGRVVTSGAMIMFVLFGSMAFTGDRTVQLVGLGLATAVLVDATVIRSLLLPAAMALLGRLNWWLPAWLERRLPALRPV